MNKDHPERGYFHSNRNIYVIGDIHGDFELCRLLFTDVTQVAKGTSWTNMKWVGGDSIVVFLGDLLDNARPDCEVNATGESDGEFSILKLFDALNRQANRLGGHILHVFGNHDLMSLLPDFDDATVAQYTSPETLTWYAQQFSGPHLSKGAMKKHFWMTGGPGHGLLVNEKAFGVLRCGQFLMMHAGPTLRNTQSILTAAQAPRCSNRFHDMNWIDVANRVTHDMVETRTDQRAKLQQSCEAAVMDRMFSFVGIYWSRQFSDIRHFNQLHTCKSLAETLTGNGTDNIKHLVVGHTIQNDMGLLKHSPGDHVWTLTKIEDEDNKRTVYGRSAKQLQWSQEMTVFPGMNFECVVKDGFALVRTDNSASRAFDRRQTFSHVLDHFPSREEALEALHKYMSSRRASCLWLKPHAAGDSPLSFMCLVVGKTATSRPWFQQWLDKECKARKWKGANAVEVL